MPRKSIGEEIVELDFSETYAFVVDSCGNLNQSSLQICLAGVYGDMKQKDSPIASKWPWWFQTLIRDSSVLAGKALSRDWHFLQFTDPLLQLCVYEKGSTKMWRMMQCRFLMGKGVNVDMAGNSWADCFGSQGSFLNNTERAVFLRDPLERFLSGFLDKCVDENHRTKEHHCLPNIR